MANVRITEFQGVGYVASGTDGMSYKVAAQAPYFSDKTTVQQAVMSSPATSPAFGQYTNLIRIETDAVIVFSIGTAPGATTNSPRMAANQTEYFCVNPGDKLAWTTSA